MVSSFTPELVAKRLKEARRGSSDAAKIADEVRRTHLDYAKIDANYHADLDFAIALLDRKQEGRALSPNGIYGGLLDAYEPRFVAHNAGNARLAMLHGKRPGLPANRTSDGYEFFLLTPYEVGCLAEIVTAVASRPEELKGKKSEMRFLAEDFVSEVVEPVTQAAKKDGAFLFGKWG